MVYVEMEMLLGIWHVSSFFCQLVGKFFKWEMLHGMWT